MTLLRARLLCRGVASTSVGSCSMVYAMSSGDVVGDWNLANSQVSAHAVALTILTTYRISKVRQLVSHACRCRGGGGCAPTTERNT